MQRSSVLILLGLLTFVPLRWMWRRPWYGESGRPIAFGREPIQREISPPRRSTIMRHDRTYLLEHLHSFDIVGEVVSTATYSWAFANPFYDVDLGLIWGPRTLQYKKKLRFYQGGRWLMWRSSESISEDEKYDIITHVGNLHLIPANQQINKAIHWATEGDKVQIKGNLVRILDENLHPIAASSTRRDDTGEGACEIIWVESIQIKDTVYR